MQHALKTRKDLHLKRKAFHVLTILGIMICMVLLSRTLCWTLYFVVGVPLLLLDLSRPYSEKLNEKLVGIMGPVIRNYEAYSLSGSSYAIVSIGLTYFIFPPMIAQLAVLFLAIGDPMASLVGILVGGPKVFANKSYSGILGGFVFCSLAAVIYFYLIGFEHQTLQLILSCGAIGALSEMLPLKVDDNLTQPLISGVLLSLLSSFYGGLLL